MGVGGLWKVLEPAGHPVSVESLEGKRLAIDVSIWLHQASSGIGTYKLNCRNPHLQILLNRLAKLLYYRIRPVFVFDGKNVPPFKNTVLAERRLKKDMDRMGLSRGQKKFLEAAALNALDSENKCSSQESNSQCDSSFSSSDFAIPSSSHCPDDMFWLPPATTNKIRNCDYDDNISSDSEYFEYESDEQSENADGEKVMCPESMSLLSDARQNLTETHKIPNDLLTFTHFQLDRLLKRNQYNKRLDVIKKEMAGKSTTEHSLKLIVAEGRKRQHVVEFEPKADDTDESKTDSVEGKKLKSDNILWPPQMPTTIPKREHSILISESPEAEKKPDIGMQMAIERSLQDKNRAGDSFGYNSSDLIVVKDENIDGLIGDFEEIEQFHDEPSIGELRQDTWSSSSTSDNDDFEDVSIEKDCGGSFPSCSKWDTSKRNSVGDSDNSNCDNDIDEIEEMAFRRKPEIGMVENAINEEAVGVYAECQELLDYLGVPYLVATGEAEAQCAALNRLGRVDAVVSEDSDVWLFGARSVYRRLFDHRRHVQYFTEQAIADILGVRRAELIQIAMLSGCDYTLGLSGTGVVSALEILAEFSLCSQEEHSAFEVLKFIENWLKNGDGAGGAVQQDGNVMTGGKKLLKKANSMVPPVGFPDKNIFNAFMHPNVDEAAGKSFEWQRPLEKELRDFVWQKLGWDRDKFDNLLKHSLDRWNGYLNGERAQTRITSFATKMVKDPADMRVECTVRVRAALQKLRSKWQNSNQNHQNDLTEKKSTKRQLPKKCTLKNRRQKGKRYKKRKNVKSTFTLSEPSDSD